MTGLEPLDVPDEDRGQGDDDHEDYHRVSRTLSHLVVSEDE